MSIIKSQDENLTLNAHGSGNDIKFQSNGVEKASISDAGLFTSTTIDATKLTGNLPAISGANLTGLSSFDPDGAVVFNESGADVDFRVESDTKVNAFTVNGATGRVGVNRGTDPDARLEVTAASETALSVTATVSGEYGVIVTSGSTNATPIMDLRNTNNASSLKVLANGRVLSQANVGFWVRFETSGTPSIQDSYNVTSIGDWGTGDYGIYITSGFSNANYCVHGTCQNDRYISVNTSNTQPQGGRVDIEIRNNSNALEDMDIVYVSAIGDM